MKNKILPIIGVLTVAMLPLASVISCGKKVATNEWANSKEIIIAVDGKQVEMYNYVKEQFKKTDAYKKDGFRIKYVTKDVFGALDQVQTLGYTDSSVADLLYAPQDRVTGLLQTKSAMPWTDSMVNTFFKEVHATAQEKIFAKKFGSVKYHGKRRMFAVPHNREGIVMVSKDSHQDVYNTLNNSNTNNLLKLVKNGDAILRLQDFWYGNGILGGMLKPDLMNKMLYQNSKGDWGSGFIKSDSNNAEYQKAIRMAADLYYYPWSAAYNKTTYNASIYKTKGITDGDLRVIVNGNVAAAQNKILELLKDKKLHMAMSGTWDLGLAKSKGINTFFSVPSLDSTHDYLQAPGSWSYVINARNNGAKSQRINALTKILSLIYSKDAYFKYFRSDSKVPAFAYERNEIKSMSATSTKAIAKQQNEVIAWGGWADGTDLKTSSDSRNGAINTTLGANFVDDWQFLKDPTNPLGKKNIVATSVKLPAATAIPALNGSLKTEFNNLTTKFKKYTGIRNAVAGILGINLDKLKGPGPDGLTYQISSELVKAPWEKKVLNDPATPKIAHVRKFGNEIFGVNGDDGNSKAKIIKELQKANGWNTIEKKALANAERLSKKYAKTTVSETQLKLAVDSYLGSYYNQATWNNWKAKYLPIYNKILFKSKDGSKSNSQYTNEMISKLLIKLGKARTTDTIFNVLTSQGIIGKEEEKIGEVKYQGTRLDHFNPQFAAVWQLWNEQTFGNVNFLTELGKKKLTKAEFEDEIVNRLSNLFTQKIDVLTATPGSTDIIDFSQK